MNSSWSRRRVKGEFVWILKAPLKDRAAWVGSQEHRQTQNTILGMVAKKTSACLDTSVLLRLLVGEPENQAKQAIEVLDEITRSGGKAHVSDLALCETYFALQYHYEVPKKEAIAALQALSQSEEIECSEVAEAVLAQVNLHSVKPGLVDRIIHGQYEEIGYDMLTFEKAAKKLLNTRVIRG